MFTFGEKLALAACGLVIIRGLVMVHEALKGAEQINKKEKEIISKEEA